MSSLSVYKLQYDSQLVMQYNLDAANANCVGEVETSHLQTQTPQHTHTSQGIPADGADQRRLMQQQMVEGREGGEEGGSKGGAGRPQPMLDQLSQSLQTDQ